jgi:hypothetical protein
MMCKKTWSYSAEEKREGKLMLVGTILAALLELLLKLAFR